jgi:hypothetical protein
VLTAPIRSEATPNRSLRARGWRLSNPPETSVYVHPLEDNKRHAAAHRDAQAVEIR